MDVVYVLMEEGWDYNDETYFRPEGGGGSPHSFYTVKADADKECDARNIEKFRSLWESGDIREYCYGIEDLLPYQSKKDKEFRKKLDAVCNRLFALSFAEISDYLDEEAEISIVGESDDDWKELMSYTRMNFWEVVTVERGQS